MNKEKERTENVNVHLSKIGFSAVYWRLFFGSDGCFYNGIINLPVQKPLGNDEFQHEVLFIDGSRRIPVQTYFQYNYGFKSSIQVYIFQCVTDALAFVQLKKMLDSNAVFLALGKNPSENVLQYVKDTFQGSQFLLGYPNSMLAKIAEIRIVGFLAGEKLGLELKDDKFYCKYKNKVVSIPVDRISLSEVRKLTGFRPKMRTLKPPKGHMSFYDLLRSINTKG